MVQKYIQEWHNYTIATNWNNSDHLKGEREKKKSRVSVVKKTVKLTPDFENLSELPV